MEIPEKKVKIYKIKLLKTQNISKKYLSNYIKKSVGSVKGDFRQKNILSLWVKTLAKTKATKFSVVSIKVRCSSGTYMRSLAHNIGKEVLVPALALRIKRTRIYR
jgi:tRNA U55 pseudouridine synthase TruB